MCSLKELSENILSPFFLELIHGVKKEKVPLINAYFISILQFIFDQSDQLDEDKCFSAKEKILFQIFVSIRDCSTAKAEAIVLTYKELPEQYQYLRIINSPENVLVVYAKTKIWQLIQDLMNQLLSSDNKMMQKIVEERGKIAQLSHQSRYLKNMLCSHIGLEHQIKFDIHSQMISNQLVKKDLNELLRVFYHYFNPELLMNNLKAISKKIVLGSSKEDRKFFNGLYELLDCRDDSTIWNFANEMVDSLTDEGALQVLIKCGVLKNI